MPLALWAPGKVGDISSPHLHITIFSTVSLPRSLSARPSLAGSFAITKLESPSKQQQAWRDARVPGPGGEKPIPGVLGRSGAPKPGRSWLPERTLTPRIVRSDQWNVKQSQTQTHHPIGEDHIHYETLQHNTLSVVGSRALCL